MAAEYDIIIAGGGLVGSSFACALQASGLRCALIDARTQDSLPDDRGIVISPPSRHFLADLGVWQTLTERQPIREVYVSERGRFGVVRLKACDVGLDVLGHVVSAVELSRQLYETMQALPHIDLICPAVLDRLHLDEDKVQVSVTHQTANRQLQGRLLVVAAGTHSTLRAQLGVSVEEEDYHQVALVALIKTSEPKSEVAFERFTEQGPVAVLPKSQGDAVLVFTVLSHRLDYFIGLSDSEFATAVEQVLGLRLGRILEVSPRHAYPVKSVVAQSQSGKNWILLGNAAHTLHPNTAQGLNLGLRDAAVLAGCLNTSLQDGTFLSRYRHYQQSKQTRMVCFNRTLGQLFYSAAVSRRVLRSALLSVFAYSQAARKRLIDFLTETKSISEYIELEQ